MIPVAFFFSRAGAKIIVDGLVTIGGVFFVV
jgi:hypothetical protein